jgi:hypothetical protein
VKYIYIYIFLADFSFVKLFLKENGHKKFDLKERLKLSLEFCWRFFISRLTLEIFWLGMSSNKLFAFLDY